MRNLFDARVGERRQGHQLSHGGVLEARVDEGLGVAVDVLDDRHPAVSAAQALHVGALAGDARRLARPLGGHRLFVDGLADPVERNVEAALPCLAVPGVDQPGTLGQIEKVLLEGHILLPHHFELRVGFGEGQGFLDFSGGATLVPEGHGVGVGIDCQSGFEGLAVESEVVLPAFLEKLLRPLCGDVVLPVLSELVVAQDRLEDVEEALGASDGGEPRPVPLELSLVEDPIHHGGEVLG